jgi:6-phosphogluconolactonase
MNIKEQNYISTEVAAQALAENLASILREAISIRGKALLAVSGGRTPKHVFDRLCQMDLDWSNVTITLTDERWVPPEHPESNERLVYSHLLKNSAADATFIPLFGGEHSAVTGQSACESRLKKLKLPFDVVYLGMGDDGHFASLFPNDAALDFRENLCVSVPPTETRLSRMSLTLPAILNTRQIFLLFSGTNKYDKYLAAQKKGSYKDVPIRLILLQKEIPVNVMYAL